MGGAVFYKHAIYASVIQVALDFAQESDRHLSQGCSSNSSEA